jgi:VWFA-related protein
MKRIAVAVLLAIAIDVRAQQSETIEVELTNLDVVVTDSKGKRVSGLTKDDFEIVADGEAQLITNFSEVSRVTSETTETIQPAPRRILFIVDNGTIELPARRKIFDATRATLERLLVGPNDRMAVATISHSIQQRLQWTADKAEVLRVLALIEKDAVLPHPGLIAFERTLGAILNDADQASASMGPPTDNNGSPLADIDPIGGSSGGGMAGRRQNPAIDFNQVIAAGREAAGAATTESKQTLSSLNGALAAFDGATGRKIVILAGGGLPLNAADSIFQRIESAREQAESHRGFKGQHRASTLTQISGYDVTANVDSLAASAKLKGVAFYAVNPEFGERQAASVTSRMRSDQTAEFAAMKGMLDGYNRLAVATGGAAMIGRPADQVLSEIVADLDSYYSLGYRSSGPLSEKSQIEVRVKKGLAARTTIASGTVNPNFQIADQVVANHLVDPTNPLNISVVLEPQVVDGDKKTIPLKILIPIDSLKLVQDGSDYTAEFAVFVSVGDAEGNGSNPARQQQSMRWPAANIAQVKGKTIGFAITIEADIERDRVSVGVLDEHSGTAGYARVMLN